MGDAVEAWKLMDMLSFGVRANEQDLESFTSINNREEESMNV